MNPKVDFFFESDSPWQKEYRQLRSFMLDCGLHEVLKWGCPCYTYNEANVVLIHGFKEYCALLFFKGALLSDPEHKLIQQTENVQSARQLRFAKLNEITKLEKIIKAYVYEAVEVEKAGLKVKFKNTNEYKIPEEFEQKLAKNAKLKKAFYALTPGRQRAYLFHFSQAKQAKTREARIAKYLDKILSGKGIDD